MSTILAEGLGIAVFVTYGLSWVLENFYTRKKFLSIDVIP